MCPDPDQCPFGSSLAKYWARLSEREREMRLTEQGLYSLALQSVMDTMVPYIPGLVVLDPFCGAGGSAIAFARAGKKVIASDSAAQSVEDAKYNAALFGVSEQIEFHVRDVFEAFSESTADTVFLDPPWGGPDYSKLERFSLSHFTPDGRSLLDEARKRFQSFALRVPKNFDLNELHHIGLDAFVQRNYSGDHLLHLMCYFRSCVQGVAD